MPGLLQTEDYAREAIKIDHPDVNDDEIDRRVQLRISRQALRRRKKSPPRLRVVLNEAILRRPVGGPLVMANQLRQIAEFASLPDVAVRVVPFIAGLHHGVTAGPFVIVRFPQNGKRRGEPPTVFADGFTGDLYLDKPAEVEKHTAAFAAIWDKALEERISPKVIEQAAEEMAP